MRKSGASNWYGKLYTLINGERRVKRDWAILREVATARPQTTIIIVVSLSIYSVCLLCYYVNSLCDCNVACLRTLLPILIRLILWLYCTKLFRLLPCLLLAIVRLNQYCCDGHSSFTPSVEWAVGGNISCKNAWRYAKVSQIVDLCSTVWARIRHRKLVATPPHNRSHLSTIIINYTVGHDSSLTLWHRPVGSDDVSLFVIINMWFCRHLV